MKRTFRKRILNLTGKNASGNFLSRLEYFILVIELWVKIKIEIF